MVYKGILPVNFYLWQMEEKKKIGLQSRIRIRLKHIFDSVGNEKLKNNLLQAIPFWIGSLLTGLIAVLFTKLFAWAEEGSAFVFKHAAWAFFILAPLCFILSWRLVARLSPYSRGSGIPQVMAAAEFATPKYNHLVDKLLSAKVVIVKIVSTLIMVFGGGAVGRVDLGPRAPRAGAHLPDVEARIIRRRAAVDEHLLHIGRIEAANDAG